MGSAFLFFATQDEISSETLQNIIDGHRVMSYVLFEDTPVILILKEINGKR